MELLPIEIIQTNQSKINEIDKKIKSIYRLIIYSRHHLDDDLLDTYLMGIDNLKNLLSLKNANLLYETINKIELNREQKKISKQ